MATENNAWAIFRDVQDKTARENICVEMKESDFQTWKESCCCADQDQALNWNYIKHRLDNSSESDKCRNCGELGETVEHIVSQCTAL